MAVVVAGFRAQGLKQGLSDGWRPGARVLTVSLQIAHGEYLTIRGPSGCGKSTLLHSRFVWTHTVRAARSCSTVAMSALPDADRQQSASPAEIIGTVFQRFFLLPMLTAAENIDVPTRAGRLQLCQSRAPAANHAELLGIHWTRASRVYRPSPVVGWWRLAGLAIAARSRPCVSCSEMSRPVKLDRSNRRPHRRTTRTA